MGSWGSEGGGIGPIVWVRRRNGSWWPGKILGPDELSECSLTSPRTGTPVKLLGREDASVDWYNLEKSKRVKAFRCGEFDDCIEKAESAQGMPIKKREKYARREDAILHALELEKQLGEQGKFGAASDSIGTKSSGSGKKKLASIHDGLGNHSEDLGNARLTQMPRGADVEIQDEMDASPIQSSGTKYSNQRTWEDDHSEATPRMRGLQDFGLRTAPLKRKYSSFDSDILGRDNHHRASLSIVPAMEKMSYANGGEQTGAIVRAKRSRCIYFPTRPTDPFDDKEHSSDQIRLSLQFEGSDHNPHCNLPKEENSSSGVMEDVESDYSQSVSSESDSSETEQDMDEEMTTSDSISPAESGGNALGNHEVSGDQENTSSEEPDESPFSGDIAQLYPDDPYLSNEAVSKWPLKGKRNIRYLARESVHGANGEYNRSSTGMYHGMKGSTPGQRTYGADGAYLDERYIGAQMVGLNNGFPYSSRFPAQDHNLIDWEDVTWESRPAFKGHWEDGRQYFNPPFFGRHHFGGRTRSMLVAVDLKVQSSYRRERVPIVSLLSKLNGRAIIGHPLQIEALQDGSSEGLVIPKEDYYTNEPVVHDGSPTLSPAWKTARRSNFRVRRPHVLSVLGGDDSTDFPLPAEQERRPPFKKSMVSSLSQNASLVRKSLPHNPRPLVDKKFPRKPLKRVGLSSNQKTRTLSSIGVQQSFGSKSVHDTRTCQMDGLIKAETSGPTTVACIPVKLVFSRLLEKINRPPSKAVCKSVV